MLGNGSLSLGNGRSGVLPSTSSDSVDQLSMLMKPGATAKPLASMMVFAAAADRLPKVMILSPRMARSPFTGAEPLPS